MSESPNRGGQPRKLLAGGAIKFRIALASGLALTIGAWLAPRAAPTTLSAPSPASTVSLPIPEFSESFPTPPSSRSLPDRPSSVSLPFPP